MARTFLISLFFVACSAIYGQKSTPAQVIPWTGTVGTDMLGRHLPTWAEAGAPREDRWFGTLFSAFPGWNNRIGNYYDVNKFLTNNPFNRRFEFDPAGSLIYPNWSWAEPWCGYYHGADPWVIRKQLVDMGTAGFEYVFWDFTNGGGGWNNWNPSESENWAILKQYLEIGTELQNQGVPVPRISIWLSTDIEQSMEFCYNLIYKDHKYDNMLFYYQDRPMVHIMAGLDRSMPNTTPGFRVGYTKDLDSTKFSDPALLRKFKEIFTFRVIFDMPGTQPEWKHVWNTWGTFPAYDLAGNIECYGTGKAVGAPIFDGLQTKGTTSVEGYNLDISNYNSRWLTPDVDKGLRNERDWNNAHASGAPMVLAARYNEWWAACWRETNMNWLGKPVNADKGEGVFIDMFNPEFSGDLEPMKDLYKDNYYWQTAGHLRIHKGMTRPEMPNGPTEIIIDGSFTEWAEVKPVYLDAPDDISNRDFRGNPTYIEGTKEILWYKNNTARNDIIESRAAFNPENVFFYVKTKAALSPSTDSQWMVLFIDTDRRKNTGWEGYDLRINYLRDGVNCSIDAYDNGNWSQVSNGIFKTAGNELEISIPRIMLGMNQTSLAFDFKWSDNCLSANPTAMDFWENGDAAPQTRLSYRFSELQDQSAFGGVPYNLPGIIEAENYNNGGEGNGFHDNTTKHIGWAYQYRNDAVDMDYLPDNKGISIGNTSAGEWLAYSVFAASEGLYTPVVYAYAKDNSGAFHIEVDGVDETGILQLPSTGGEFEEFLFVSNKIHLSEGNHIVKIVFDGSMDLDAWGLTVSCDEEQSSFNPHTIPGIIEAENYDNGCHGKAWRDAFFTNEDGFFRNDGVDIDTITDGYAVSSITRGEWLEYTIFADTSGIYKLDMIVAAAKDNNTFHVSFDDLTKTRSILVNNTGGKQNLISVSDTIILHAGKQLMRVNIDQADNGLFLDRFSFSLLDTCTPQGVVFDSIPDIMSSVPKISLHASVPSILPVFFSIVSGPATINKDTLLLSYYKGSVTVMASQPGNDMYCPASKERSFTIIHDCLAQTISYNPLPAIFADSPGFVVTATANSGLPVELGIRSGPATLNGNVVTLDGVLGTLKFNATQEGNAAYCPVEDTFLNIMVKMPAHQCTGTEGLILMEKWTGIEGDGISSIPLNQIPNTTNTLTKMEIPTNTGDKYGVRLSGFLCAPYTAEYVFSIASDDNGELWLSTDDTKTNKQRIAYVPGWADEYQWNKFPEQTSAPVALTGGQKYYIEALMKEWAGGDNLAVRWATIYGINEVIPGEFLSLPCKIQTITLNSTFSSLGGNRFLLQSSSSSGLPVSLQLTAGDASLNGDTITINAERVRVTIKASQAGDEEYCRAVDKLQVFNLSKPTGAEASNANPEIQMYPNPAKDVLYISNFELQISEITISDMLGKVVYQINQTNTESLILDLGQLQNGMYFIKCKTGDGIIPKKIIIKK